MTTRRCRLQRPAFSRELLDCGRPQCSDPIQTGRPQCLLDPRAGQQSAVAHHHHALQLEALLQLVDLCRQRHRIGGVAFEHLDRNRAAPAIVEAVHAASFRPA